MLFRLCIAFTLLHISAVEAVQLPESYGVFFKDSGKYQPVQRTLNSTQFNSIPVVKKAANQFELLIHSKNFDHKRVTVLYKSMNPMLLAEALNIDISPLKRKDTYKIIIKKKLPKDGLLIYQYKNNLLSSETYTLALRNPEKSLEDLFSKGALPYKQRNLLVRSALVAYPQNSLFKKELQRIEQEYQVMSEQRSYNVATSFAKNASETQLSLVRDTYKKHLQQFPDGKHNEEIKVKLAEVEAKLAEQQNVADAEKAKDQVLMDKAQAVIDNYITAFNEGNCKDALKYVLPTTGVEHYTKQCKGQRKYDMLKIVGIRGKSKGRKGEEYVLFFTKKPKRLQMNLDKDSLKISSFN